MVDYFQLRCNRHGTWRRNAEKWVQFVRSHISLHRFYNDIPTSLHSPGEKGAGVMTEAIALFITFSTILILASLYFNL